MQDKKRIKFIRHVESVITLFLGSALYAVGYVALIAPRGLVLGGATGIATALFALWHIPVGLTVFLVNLPLVIWSCFVGGRHATARSLVGVVGTSLLLSALEGIFVIQLPTLWSALLGGAVTGSGIGLLLAVNFTTGGSELAAALLSHRRQGLSVGRLVLLFDTVIVLLATAVLGDARALPCSIALNLSFAVFLDFFMRIGTRLPYPINH